jgi:hypothetical protein
MTAQLDMSNGIRHGRVAILNSWRSSRGSLSWRGTNFTSVYVAICPSGGALRPQRALRARMVASGVVDYDPRDGTYALPCEHAAFLRLPPPPTWPYLRNTSLCSGGSKTTLWHASAWAGFERFHEVMAEDSGQTVLPVLKSHILALVPGLDERLKDGIVSSTSAAGGAGR